MNAEQLFPRLLSSVPGQLFTCPPSLARPTKNVSTFQRANVPTFKRKSPIAAFVPRKGNSKKQTQNKSATATYTPFPLVTPNIYGLLLANRQN